MLARFAILLLTCLSCQAQPWWVRPVSSAVPGWIVEVVVTNATAQTFEANTFTPASVTVEWGDGSTSNLTGNATAIHTYAAASTNLMVIRGSARRLTFGAIFTRLWRLKRSMSIIEGLTLSDMQSTFQACDALSYIPAGLLVNQSSTITNLQATWRLCGSLTNPPAVSNLTLVSGLFQTWASVDQCKNFPDVSALTNVTTLGQTWAETTATNYPDISALTNVTTLANAWERCFRMTNIPPISPSTNLVNVSAAFLGSWRLNCASVKFWDTNLFPNIDTSNIPTIDHCYLNCSNLTDWTSIPNIFRF